MVDEIVVEKDILLKSPPIQKGLDVRSPYYICKDYKQEGTFSIDLKQHHIASY